MEITPSWTVCHDCIRRHFKDCQSFLGESPNITKRHCKAAQSQVETRDEKLKNAFFSNQKVIDLFNKMDFTFVGGMADKVINKDDRERLSATVTTTDKVALLMKICRECNEPDVIHLCFKAISRCSGLDLHLEQLKGIYDFLDKQITN